MRRHIIAPRHDWRDRARDLGFAYAEIAGEPYWDETACWEFTSVEVDALDDALAELERLTRLAADHAVRHDRHAQLGIPAAVWPLMVRSWERQEPSLYGRMDFCWDGTGQPKLLEYNADTPTTLFESSVVQWEWLSCAFPDMDQFNSIHEALIAAWPKMGLPPRVHFCGMRDSAEDRGNIDYLRDTAVQAGLDAPFLFVDEIGWDGRRFVDTDRAEIRAVFKLYPWEFLLRDDFGNHIAMPVRGGSSRHGGCCCPARASWPCCGNCFPAIPICCLRFGNLAEPAAQKSRNRSLAARERTSPHRA